MWQPQSKFWLFGFLAVFALGGFAQAGVTVPDWVQQAAASTVGSYSPEATAVVLVNQTNVTVLESGDYIEHSREVLKVLRPDWRGDRDLAVMLQRGEKINFIHSWTIDAAGHQFELKDKDFVEAAPFSFELYSDIHWRYCQAAAPYPGSIVAFEYEVRRHPWFPEISFVLQDANPVVQEIISLSLPAGWEYKDSWTETTAVRASQPGPNQWKWVISGLPGIDKEPQMPSVVALAPKLDIAFFHPGQVGAVGSWNEIGRWYTGLTAERRKATSDIDTKTAALIEGKPDFDSRIHALTEFIQSEIRYVAIEIGIGGYQPHAAADIFRERYGDCKDKVTLLSVMLEAAHIHGSYVIISTHRGLVHPKLPSTGSFNHAIIAIEIPAATDATHYRSVVTASNGKRYIIFDPTDEYTPVGSLRAELQNTYALLVTESGGELIRTPLLEPDSNKITRLGHFLLSANGTLSGEVNEGRSGDFATLERYRLRHSDQRQQINDLEHWLGRSLQGFTVQGLDIQDAEVRQKDVTLQYRFAVPSYGQARGSLMLLRPSVLKQKGALVEHKMRHYPLELGQTARETDTYEIEIPTEYQVDDIPNPVKVDMGFASYESKIEVEGSKLRYWREYIVRDLSVPPEKFKDWASLQGTIGADESAAVVLKRVQ
jgi:hypothetical protein